MLLSVCGVPANQHRRPRRPKARTVPFRPWRKPTHVDCSARSTSQIPLYAKAPSP